MTATARSAPFRAGRAGPRETVDGGVLRQMAGAHASGTRTLLADVSEFQPDVADAKYLAWSKAIVIRAAYGDAHDDQAWYGGQRRALLHDGGVLFLGIYQYVVAGQDITAQARAFCRLIGKLEAGEYPVADWEEGGGDQSARRAAWNHVVASELGFTPGTGYSGLEYAAAHGLAPVEWVAAYQNAEPSVPHLLWQFTDSFGVPGIGPSDCSVHNGPVTDLAAHAFGGSQPAPPAEGPAFPWMAADYIGVQSADPHCHSGFTPADRPHISVWQAQMAHRGWTLPLSGTYDHVSEAVCTQFQREKGLTADGKVGPVTWMATWTAPVT